jgi:hypothetical protein
VENRQRHMIARERFVNVEHPLCFFTGFVFRLVHGVAFLPEELCGP